MSSLPKNRLVVTVVHHDTRYPPLGAASCVAYAETQLAGANIDVAPRYVAGEDELAALLQTPGRHVLLFGNYLWSLDRNLALSTRARELSADAVLIHGGPSTPSRPDELRAFMDLHRHIDAAVFGEGEQTLVDLLQALLGEQEIGAIPGCAHRLAATAHGSDALVLGPDRVRLRDLSVLPSPYLTGRFPDEVVDKWEAGNLETNRGCPYACSFCDWGSATMQKIHRFPMERICGEIEWLGERNIPSIWVTDANFGVFKRDVDIGRAICDTHARLGAPRRVIAAYAKNKHRYLVEIVEMLQEHGLIHSGMLSLQTTDTRVLEAIDRTNISLGNFDRLAKEFQERQLPLTTQLMLGLPESTREGFLSDLRWQFDTSIEVQVFLTIVLPNSPMGHPEYMSRFGLQVDPRGRITQTHAMPSHVLQEMILVSRIFRGVSGYGLLRYLFRFAQWDAGMDPVELMCAFVQHAHEEGFPHDWHAQMVERERDPVDLLNTQMALREALRASDSWHLFHEAFFQWLETRGCVVPDSVRRTILKVQTAVMPAHGRRVHRVLVLEHDVASWYRDHLAGQGRPLQAYPMAWFETEDPAGVGQRILQRQVPDRYKVAWELANSIRAIRHRTRVAPAQAVPAAASG